MPHLAALAAALVAALACAIGQPASAVAQAPAPDDGAFLAAVRENLARSQAEQYRYGYKERRTELHMNPFGRIGTGGVRVYEVTPAGEPNVYMRRLIERDGRPVPGSTPEREDRRASAQGRSTVEDVLNGLTFSVHRREVVSGRSSVVVYFAPRPGARPRTREGRMAQAFTGWVWVDEAAREVTRVTAEAYDDLSFGWGIIARLHKGARLSASRDRVDGDIWLLTSVRLSGEGRAVLFRRLTVDHVIEWFDYRRVLP